MNYFDILTQGQKATLIYKDKPRPYVQYYFGAPIITEEKEWSLDTEAIFLFCLSYVNVFQVYDSYRWRAIDKIDMDNVRKRFE